MFQYNSDFDDNTTVEGQPSGLAATQVFAQTPAAANLLAGTSSNPLDDLVSIFGGSGGGGGVPMSATTHLGFGALGGTGMGVGSGFGGMPLSPMPPQTPNPALPPKTSSQQPQDDLLGLF
jgi:AP-1 complex subunit beta-1